MVNKEMNTQHSNHKPDFFAVLVLLVILGFGLTITVQIVSSDVDHMVDRQSVKTEVSG